MYCRRIMLDLLSGFKVLYVYIREHAVYIFKKVRRCYRLWKIYTVQIHKNNLKIPLVSSFSYKI